MRKPTPDRRTGTEHDQRDAELEAALSQAPPEPINSSELADESDHEDDSVPAVTVPAGMIRAPAKGERPLPDIRPPWHKYGTDEPAGRKPRQFFDWWSGLGQKDQQRLIAYVYRSWPVGFQEKTNPRTKKATRSTQIAKVAGEQPIKDLEDFKRRFGSGEYRIRLNEQVSQKTTICFCHIQIHDEEYPPVISDLAWLDLHHPLNKSYIEFLRFKGVEIPGDKRQTERQEEEDMANTEAVKELTGAVTEMAQLAVSTAQRGEKQPVDSATTAVIKGLEVMQQAGNASIAMVKEAAASLNRPAALDPVESLGRLAGTLKDVASALRPEKDDSSTHLMGMLDAILKQQEISRQREGELYTRLLGIQADQINRLQTSVDRLLTEKQAQAATAAPPGSIEELVGKLKSLRSGLKELMGENEDDRPARRGSLLETLVENAPALLQGLGGVVSGAAAAWHNAAVVRTGQGTPIPVTLPTATAESPAEIPPPATGTAEQQQEVRNMLDQLQMLKAPLVKALDDGKTGDEFADDMIELMGRSMYDQIREAGKETLYKILQLHLPDVWRMAQGMPQRFDRFIDQFLSRDEILVQEEAEAQATQKPARKRGPKVTVLPRKVVPQETQPAPDAA